MNLPVRPRTPWTHDGGRSSFRGSPDDFRAFTAARRAKWQNVAKSTNIKIDWAQQR